jgi:hypothetical protein
MNIARVAPGNYAFRPNESTRIDLVHGSNIILQKSIAYFICVAQICL